MMNPYHLHKCYIATDLPQSAAYDKQLFSPEAHRGLKTRSSLMCIESEIRSQRDRHVSATENLGFQMPSLMNIEINMGNGNGKIVFMPRKRIFFFCFNCFPLQSCAIDLP